MRERATVPTATPSASLRFLVNRGGHTSNSAMAPDRRTINAYAATKPGLEVEPFEYVSRPLGVEDVEIAISHCGICGSDLHTISGGWRNGRYPVVPGHEIVGHVTAKGPRVTHLKIGDRVGVGAMVAACLKKDTCSQCASDNDAYCPKSVGTYNSKYADGEKSYGGYAEHLRVSSHYAFKIPDVIPSDQAAPLLCAGVTVYAPLKKYIKAGDRVGVVGIGGLGHLGIQFAKALGATPIAFSQSPNKEQAARELGAEAFVVTSDKAAVKKARRSVNILLVTADTENQPWDTYLSFLDVGGVLILVGLPNDKIKFSPFGLVPRAITFVGSMIGGIKDTQEMLALAAAKGVRPVIQKLPMDKANEGIKLVDEGKARYRVVLENPIVSRL